jgi:GH24 family phage-related lysozyme (muramidase)
MVYGSNSRVDEMMQDRFGAMAQDVFGGGGNNPRATTETTQTYTVLDKAGNEITVTLKQGGSKTLSQEGIAMLQSWEVGPNGTVALMPYDDGKGNMTIGWGHKITKGENFDNGLTEEEAFCLFNRDLKAPIFNVNSYVNVNLTQWQFDALVMYNFNGGPIYGSRMLTYLNNEDYENASCEIMAAYATNQNTHNKDFVYGLALRCLQEQNLFNYNIYRLH